MLLNIRHETQYRYAVPAHYSLQVLHLWPRADAGQRVLHWNLETPGRRWSQVDAFGNVVHYASLDEKHDRILVVAHGQVETLGERGVPRAHDCAVPPLAFTLATRLTSVQGAVEGLAAEVFADTWGGDASTPERLHRLMQAIQERMDYVQGVTDVHATAAQSLEQGQGVCQDMAHVFLACCRARGVAARYVSGYYLADADHAASHAWVEAWVPTARNGAGGWLGFDVTHDRLAGPELCRLAVGRDYADASPVRGIHVGGTGEELCVRVEVARSELRAEQ